MLKEHDEATVETLDNIQKLLESVASFIESTVQERDTAMPRAVQAETKLATIREVTASVV